MSVNPFVDMAARPARILVVDDERDNREVLDLVLAWEGFLISQAGSGSEALAMVAKQSPDLILLDIMMPGMTGYEVLAKLKSDPATSDTPVMMVSAIMDPNAKGKALTAGAADFLAKPIDRDQLVQQVRNLLRKSFPGYRESDR
jgi:CheY-like chemotaxis protein